MNTDVDKDLKTPGQRLKDARDLKELSLGVVAQRLRLSEHQVQAIENDQHDQFPAFAYVRGYIRSYAKLVELNSDQLVEQLEKSAKSTPVLEPFASQPDQQTGSGDKHIKAVTYSLIATLLLLLGLWWQSNRSTPEVAPELEASSDLSDEKKDLVQLNETISEPEVVEIIQTEAPSNEEASQEVPSASENVVGLEIEQEGPSVLEHDFPVVQFSELPTPPDQNSSVEVSYESITATGDETNTEQTLSPLTSNVATEEDVQAFDDQRIILQFTDESWVEITDSTDKVRFSRIGKPGEVVSMTGGAPFSVVIGKASVVIMNYQGNIIDLNSLARGEVARFTIDENGAHR